MHRKTLVGATVAAIVLSAGGVAIAAQVSDDGTVPAKITNTGPQRGQDKAYDEATDTGYMPVVGRDGVRAGVIDWKQWSTPDRPRNVAVYDKSPAEGGKAIGTFGQDGLTINGQAR